MTTAQEHQRKLVISFILPARQTTTLNDLKSQNAGMTFIGSLAHCKYLDARYAVRIASHMQHAPDILRLLQSLGARGLATLFQKTAN